MRLWDTHKAMSWSSKISGLIGRVMERKSSMNGSS